MRRFIRRLAGAMMAVAWLATGAMASSGDPDRRLTVEDLLGLEAFGRADISPDGRWAVYEKRAGYNTMTEVRLGGRSTWTIMDLWLADLKEPATPPRRLLPAEGLGLQRIAWSPDSKRLLVTRLRGQTFEYGVVTISDGAVTWTGLTPDLPLNGAGAFWASSSVLVFVVRPDGSLPLVLGYDGAATTRRAEAWERTAGAHEPSRTVIEAHGGVVSTETPEPIQRLVRYDTVTGEAKILLEARIGDFALSPDGTKAVVIRRAEQMPLGRPELLHMEDDRRHRVAIIDLESGRVVASPDDLDVAFHLLRWSPDSRGVLVWARRDGERWTEGRLGRVSVDGVDWFVRDKLDVGTSAEVALSGVKADWIGASPVVYAKDDETGRRDWHLLSPDGPPRALTEELATAPTRIAAAGPDVLYAFADGAYWALTGSGVRRLMETGANVREALVFDPILGRRLKGNEAPRRNWSPAIAEDGESLIVGENGATSFGGVASKDDKVVAVSAEGLLMLRSEGLSETLIRRSLAPTRNLDSINQSLSDVVLTEAQPIVHLDINGRQTTSWLFLPKGAARDIRGVIVKVYPGWADNLARVDPLAMTYSTRPEVFVSAGYAVLSPSIPGDLSVRDRGDAYVRSADLAVDAARVAFPEAPFDRMVLWGHSFGGYATLEIATRSDRYLSYIASSGYSDMPGVWGEFDSQGRIQPENGIFFRFNQGWTEVGQGGLAAPPWSDPDLYVSSSPFLRADRIKRPILFLTADMDFAPMSQSERMFSAVLRNSGDARMVTYWGEKHVIWSPANIRDYYAQIFDWLDRTLSDPDRFTRDAPGDLPKDVSIPPAPRSPG